MTDARGKPVPRYTHDCEKCEYLGTYNDHDLYHCNKMGRLPTVIARRSSEPSDYLSGMSIAARVRSGQTDLLPLRVAYLIAEDLGLLE